MGRNADICLLSRASNHSICIDTTDRLGLIKEIQLVTRTTGRRRIGVTRNIRHALHRQRDVIEQAVCGAAVAEIMQYEPPRGERPKGTSATDTPEGEPSAVRV